MEFIRSLIHVLLLLPFMASTPDEQVQLLFQIVGLCLFLRPWLTLYGPCFVDQWHLGEEGDCLVAGDGLCHRATAARAAAAH